MSQNQTTGIHKVRRAFGDPVEAPKPYQRFIKIPEKFKKLYSLELESILSKKSMNSILKQGKILIQMAVAQLKFWLQAAGVNS